MIVLAVPQTTYGRRPASRRAGAPAKRRRQKRGTIRNDRSTGPTTHPNSTSSSSFSNTPQQTYGEGTLEDSRQGGCRLTDSGVLLSFSGRGSCWIVSELVDGGESEFIVPTLPPVFWTKISIEACGLVLFAAAERQSVAVSDRESCISTIVSLGCTCRSGARASATYTSAS